MWIRMISTAAGPRLPHCLQSGSVYQVSDELGRELVDGLAATEVADPRPKKVDAPAEVAAVDDGEKALDPAGEKKSKSLIEQLTKTDPAAKGENNGADASDEANDAESADAGSDAGKKKSAKAVAKKS